MAVLIKMEKKANTLERLSVNPISFSYDALVYVNHKMWKAYLKN
jgi:hypothetical protein